MSQQGESESVSLCVGARAGQGALAAMLDLIAYLWDRKHAKLIDTMQVLYKDFCIWDATNYDLCNKAKV